MCLLIHTVVQCPVTQAHIIHLFIQRLLIRFFEKRWHCFMGAIRCELVVPLSTSLSRSRISREYYPTDPIGEAAVTLTLYRWTNVGLISSPYICVIPRKLSWCRNTMCRIVIYMSLMIVNNFYGALAAFWLHINSSIVTLLYWDVLH